MVSTFERWKAVVEANDAVVVANYKTVRKSNILKGLALSPLLLGFFIVLGLVSMSASHLGLAGRALIAFAAVFFPGLFAVLLVLTPNILKLQPKEDEKPYRDAWAQAHGLEADENLPSMRTYDYKEDGQVFIQRVGDKLNAYRLVNEGGKAVLYNAEGSVIRENLDLVKVKTSTVQDDPNAELWEQGSKHRSTDR